jgi:hypothetical protein
MSKIKMKRINEFKFEPGVYTFNGILYVVTDVITHAYNAETSKAEALPDPLVIYRDVVPVSNLHRVYSINLSIAKAQFQQQ